MHWNGNETRCGLARLRIRKYEPHRTAKSDYAYAHAPFYSAYERIQHEDRKPRARGIAALHVLQLRQDSPEFARNASNGGRANGPRLVSCGTCGFAFKLDHYPNLTVLDIDGGVGDYDNVMAWAKANGIPETYVVTTGRLGGGYHFYFSGTRPPGRKDVSKNPHADRRGFELNGAHGDIKCHGHVVAEGGLHKTGVTYRGNGLLVAPLPDWLRDWEEESVKARRETIQRQLERIRQTQSLNVVPWKRRNDFLYRDACRLHYLGLNEETLYAALKDIARRYCADGEEYVIQQDTKIRSVAARVSAMTYDRIVNSSLLGKPTGDLVVKAPALKPKHRLMAWLTRQFPVGEQVTVSSIMDRFDSEHLGERRPGRTTLFRAMRSANFREVGRDPRDGRTSLWARHGDS